MAISVLKNLKSKIIGFLKQGITPQKLAVAFSLGICIGIIPLLGSTSLLCMLVAFLFRLNMATIQTVNYLTYPLQLILYIPFLKAGAYAGGMEFNYSLEEIVTMLSENTWNTIQRFFAINIYAVLLWLFISVVLYLALYFILVKIFIRLSEVLQRKE